MGCLGWVLIAPFVGLGYAAIKAVDYFIKKGKKPLGILISILLGGICLGLGYDLAYVGWTEYEGLTLYQVTYPVAGWIGMVIGGGTVIGGIIRTLAMTKEQVELEELVEKLKGKSSSDEDKKPRT
jgi:hypothetical protein